MVYFNVKKCFILIVHLREKMYLRWSPLIEVATNKEVIEPSVPIG